MAVFNSCGRAPGQQMPAGALTQPLLGEALDGRRHGVVGQQASAQVAVARGLQIGAWCHVMRTIGYRHHGTRRNDAVCQDGINLENW